MSHPKLLVLCGNDVFSGTDVLKSSNECGNKLDSSFVKV